jgi:phenylpropionate dioxygenase-like ring-hydroxylating dioxygenase large terminal subunit
MGLLKDDKGFPPIRTLVGEMAERTTTPLVLPSVYVGCTVDCAYYLRIQPMGVDRMVLEQGGMFPRDVVGLPDFEERAQAYYRRWDTTAQEDNDVCERQQQGLSSPLCVPGRFSHREENLHRISRWIIDRILER